MFCFLEIARFLNFCPGIWQYLQGSYRYTPTKPPCFPPGRQLDLCRWTNSCCKNKTYEMQLQGLNREIKERITNYCCICPLCLPAVCLAFKKISFFHFFLMAELSFFRERFSFSRPDFLSLAKLSFSRQNFPQGKASLLSQNFLSHGKTFFSR